MRVFGMALDNPSIVANQKNSDLPLVSIWGIPLVDIPLESSHKDRYCLVKALHYPFQSYSTQIEQQELPPGLRWNLLGSINSPV